MCEACENEVKRLQARVAELEQERAWANGRRGDSLTRAPGFTELETRILRMLAACGAIYHDQAEVSGVLLWKHMSNIRRKLPADVKVRTVIEAGYQVESGQDVLKAILNGEYKGALPAPPRRGELTADARETEAA